MVKASRSRTQKATPSLARHEKRYVIENESIVGSSPVGPQPAGSLTSEWTRPSFMVETHAGGLLESVDGFVTTRAVTEGYRSLVTPLRLLSSITGKARNLPVAVGSTAHYRRESAHGTDDRVEVANTERAPWRSICHLEVTFTTGKVSYATGWFIGPRTVVTAGHALVDPNSRAWASEVLVVPGRRGDFAPFGHDTATSIDVDRRWYDEGKEAYDVGAVFLPDHKLGETVGWFGVAAPSDADLSQKPLINNAGYPVESSKPFGTLWYNAGRIVDFDPAFLYYMVDTAEGQSGSPVFFRKHNDQRLVLAVHTYGGDDRNKGRRVTRDLVALFDRWINV